MKTRTLGEKKNMWKIIAIILIIVDLVVLCLKGCGAVMDKAQSVPEDYTKKVQTGGDIEAKYLAMGTHEVSYKEIPAMMSFKKYEIFYPSDMADMDSPLPAVIFVNGTGIKGTKYQALQKHLASRGFITVATDEGNAWNGFSAEMSVRYLETLNTYKDDKEDNIFYGKIDMDAIGITGHSQGGIGVINAITDQKHASVYKAAVALSSTQTDMAKALQWDSDASEIRTPFLMISSTGSTDEKITPLSAMQATFASIPDSVTKVLARRNTGDHGEMLYSGDGYVTAWFAYYLQGDEEAGKAFFGSSPEISSNELYQDEEISAGEK